MTCDIVGTYLYQQKYSIGLSSRKEEMCYLTACFSLDHLEVYGLIQDMKKQIFVRFKTHFSDLLLVQCGGGFTL